jgi:pyruvate dehydrogenase E2 component (dihydrolipoamide acetyltransferase)
LILAFDHRVVDGADAARFMNMVIDILEDPNKLLMAV